MLKSGADLQACWKMQILLKKCHYDHILHGFLNTSIVHLFTPITKFIEGGRPKTHLIQNRQQEKRSNILDIKENMLAHMNAKVL
jgi:hypothetical protein